MDKSTIAQIQKDFILKKLRFDALIKYFGNISSNDLSTTHRNIGFRNDGQGVDLYINNLNNANIAKSLKEHMSFNPLRWQEIASLNFPREGVINSLDNECWHKDGFGMELYSVLNDIYTKGIFNLNAIEITKDKNKQAHNNYWILRNTFNIFKKICETNVKDFKTTQYCDSIVITMNEKFPKQVNPENFGLILVPEKQPADLFTKWHWERQM
jgi:hypothetical protein